MEKLTRWALEKMSASDSQIEDWTALLDVMSIDHQLSETRPLAIQKITSKFSTQLDGMEKIALGRKYQVKDWLQAGIQQLVEQKEAFSPTDEAKLGPEMLIKLYRIREDRYREEIRVLRKSSPPTLGFSAFEWGGYWDHNDPGEKYAPLIRAGIEREFGSEWSTMV